MRARFGVFGVLFLTAMAVSPARAADALHGHAIATRWCAACHLIAPEQTQAKADAPPFATLARTTTGAALRAFLANPYPRMPDMSLSRDEIADLVAFIKTYGLAPGETPDREPNQTDAPSGPQGG